MPSLSSSPAATRDNIKGRVETKPPVAVGPTRGRKRKRKAGGLRQRRRPSEKAPPDSPLQAIMDESAKAFAIFFDNADPPVLCDDDAEAGESDRAVASLARAAAAAIDRRDFCDDLSAGLSR